MTRRDLSEARANARREFKRGKGDNRIGKLSSGSGRGPSIDSREQSKIGYKGRDLRMTG